MIQPNYTYKGLIRKVVDGDTVDCSIDVGFKMFSEQRLRLARIDTPEINSKSQKERKRAQAAKERVEELIGGKSVIVITQKTGMYGRYIAEVWFLNHINKQVNISDLLLEEGLASKYEE